MNLSRVQALTRAARQVARANVRRLDVPLKINFAVTYQCQYRCKTCNIWTRTPQGELSTDEILRFIGNTSGVSWLDVTGGEIFLRRDIGHVLEAFAGTWHDLILLHFPTNGFLTDRIVAVCERLAARARGPHIVVTVSLDGDETLNDEVRGIRGGYRRQVATFNALRRVRGIRPVFGMTLSAWNVGRFEETFQACQRDCPGLDIADFHLNVAQQSQHYYGNAGDGSVPSRDDVAGELRVYRSMRRFPRTPADWLEAAYLRRLEAYVQTKAPPMRCHSLRSSCFIDPCGTVFPCITYTRPLGSLRDTGMDLGPIWEAAETARTQSEIWDGRCPQCWTACEAYQSILGNLARPWDRAPQRHEHDPHGRGTPIPIVRATDV